MLQDDCERLRQRANEEFQPDDQLAAGLLWLSGTTCVTMRSLKSSLEVLPQHAAFVASPGYCSSQEQLMELQSLVHELVQQLNTAVTGSKARTSNHQQVLHAALVALDICLLQPQLDQAVYQPRRLQWHTHQLMQAQLEPAASNLITLQRVAVQLVLLCCRLARCNQPACSAELDATIRQATGIGRQLGLAQVIADMPHEAAELQQPIRQLQHQLRYAAAAAVDRDWLVLQCSQGAVAGPVTLLQACQLQLQATGRALLPASFLGLRFIDCMVGMRQSLFSSIQPGLRATGASDSDAAFEAQLSGDAGPLEILHNSVAARFLKTADVPVLRNLLQASCRLMHLDVSAAPETALVHSSGACALLDDFKHALSAAEETLSYGRPLLQSSCSRWGIRGELLQKEVLKAEVSLVRQAFRYQVEAGQEEHLQHLQRDSTQLWVDSSTAQHDMDCTDIAGWVPAWETIQLGSVAHLPSLLKLLQQSGPTEAAGQLEAGSSLGLEWFGTHQVMEACLRHGIEGQGELLRSIYDFCPRVLHVSQLLTDHRRTALLGKQLYEQSLRNINAACAGSRISSIDSRHQQSASIKSTPASNGHHHETAARSHLQSLSADQQHDSTENSSSAEPSIEAGAADSSAPVSNNAAELLADLLSSTTPTSDHAAAATDNGSHSGGATTTTAATPFSVLEKLQHPEDWAFSQISGVVWEELGHVLSGLNTQALGFAARETAVKGLLKQWYEDCDELVQARSLGRRSVLDKILQKVRYYNWRIILCPLPHSNNTVAAARAEFCIALLVWLAPKLQTLDNPIYVTTCRQTCLQILLRWQEEKQGLPPFANHLQYELASRPPMFDPHVCTASAHTIMAQELLLLVWLPSVSCSSLSCRPPPALHTRLAVPQTYPLDLCVPTTPRHLMPWKLGKLSTVRLRRPEKNTRTC